MIIPEVMDQVQDEGGTISLTCSATGQPLPTISWYFNGVPINEINTMKYTISGTLLNTTTISSTLTVMNVESSDVGTYTCNATNVVSTDISAGILTVNGELIATVGPLFLRTAIFAKFVDFLFYTEIVSPKSNIYA